jgi:hypothetical protein
MSEGTVRQLCRVFKDGRTNVHDLEWSGRLPFVVSDDHLFQSVDQKICERLRLTIQTFRVNFHKFHALSCRRLSQLC